jgi:hypothetical protein
LDLGGCTASFIIRTHSPNIIRQMNPKRMGWAGHLACMAGERSVSKVLVGNSEGRRPLGRPEALDERTGLDWILGRLAGGGLEWIYLARDMDRWRAVVSTLMNVRVLAPRI